MHLTSFGKAPRSLALLAFLSLSFSIVSAQARHEYADPTPQRYQRAPVPEQLPNYEPAPSPGPAQGRPMQQQPVATDSMSVSGNQLLDFIHQHLALTFICILLIAPFWAMLGMRKTKHPYDH